MALEGWAQTTLEMEVDLLTGFPFKSANYTASDDGIRLARGDNVVQGRFRWEGVKRWSTCGSAEYDTYLLKAGDVVVAMDRPWIEAGLKFACVSDDDFPCLLVQRVARLRAGPTLDQGFLRYIIGSREFTNHVLAVQTGTAVPHISAYQIKEFSFARPSLPEQRAIAHILGTLDDKIELNRRMNETLEAMARALFQSWFVDFDPVRAKAEGREPEGMDAATTALFPDGFEESEVGPVPLEWRVGKLGDVADNPRRGVDPTALSSDTPYIGLEHMPRKSIALGDWDYADKVTSNKSMFFEGEILFGKLRPYFHKVGVAPLDGVCSTDIVVIAPKQPLWSSFVLAIVSSDDFVRHTDASSAGTKMPRTNWFDMARYGAVVPPDTVAAAFDNVARPMIENVRNNIHESRTLAAIRDALLPKLLSGEMRVGDAERFVSTEV